jgi:hypothetical protein
MIVHKTALLSTWITAAAAALGAMTPGAAQADVTIVEQSTFDLSIVKAHGEATELTSADKQRRDSAFHCDGFMSLLCGNAQSGEIIRLDRDVRWSLEPKKQEYRETPFLTPAQRQAAEQQAAATLDKMKQCPAAQRGTAPAPDTQKCQMTPPKFDLVQTDQHATLAGHDARLTQITLTQSCANPDTGDSCDFQIGMDAWLSEDTIAGLDDRRAFLKAYLHKMGLDSPDSVIQGQMRKFLAPYETSLKQLAGKAGALKGYPLKSAVRIAFGGPHCASAQSKQNDTAASDANSGQQQPPTSLGSVASNLGGKLMGGLFKKKADPAPDASQSSALPPGMVQAAQFTTETQSIAAGPIAPAQFEIPAGWKLVTPEPRKEKEFSCPGTGS